MGKAANVRFLVEDDGAGRVETYNATGKRLCSMGVATNGNGGFWAFHKDNVTGKPANVKMYVNDNGGGKVDTYNAAGRRLSAMGESTAGNGGFWAYDKDGKKTRSMP